MKSKLLVAIALAIVTGAVWWSSHRRAGPARDNSRAAMHGKTTASSRHGTALRTPVPRIPPAEMVKAEAAATPMVQEIVGSQTDYRARFDAIHALPTALPATDWEVLQEFLLRRDAADDQQGGQMLKNRLMNALCELNPMPPDLEDTLTQIYQDRGQDQVVRDYALQHLVEYCQQLDLLHADAPIARAQAQELLWDALTETEDGLAGTALLGLERLSRQQTDLDRDRLQKAALDLAGNANETVAITALQVCSQMDVKDAAAIARQTAQNANSIPLRISAIAALGTLGNSSDKTWLEQVANGTVDRLKLPAQRALVRLQQLETKKEPSSKGKI